MATDVLRRMGGVTVIPNPRYLRGTADPAAVVSNLFNIDLNPFIVMMSRAKGRASFGGGSGRANQCPPLYFVDRHYFGPADEIDIDQVLQLVDIEAVEAYASAASIPAEFNRPGAQCGVIVFWTR